MSADFVVRIRQSGPRGWPRGEGHHHARYSDALVELACALVACGVATCQETAAALGCSVHSVKSWSCGRRRRPPMRVVAQRVPTDHQSFRPRLGPPIAGQTGYESHPAPSVDPGPDAARWAHIA